jgi:hypothetical protein
LKVRKVFKKRGHDERSSKLVAMAAFFTMSAQGVADFGEQVFLFTEPDEQTLAIRTLKPIHRAMKFQELDIEPSASKAPQS